MKQITFPVTNRVHLARQKYLLEELERAGIRVVTPYFPAHIGDMAERTVACMQVANEFMRNTDLALIRGDRFEMLPFAIMAAYRGIPVAHIEAGDLSGAIDNKVRHAITQLSDYWFPTNNQAAQRLLNMGVDPMRVWNFGSLDVEVAMQHELKPAGFNRPYVVFAFHPVNDEKEEEVLEWLRYLCFERYEIVHIRSNGDYASPMGESHEFQAGRYLDLIAGADILVGNSSSFLKEASVYGTPVVLVGSRQHDRLMPENVAPVPYHQDYFKEMFNSMAKHGRYNAGDSPYFQPHTAEKIAKIIIEILK